MKHTKEFDIISVCTKCIFRYPVITGLARTLSFLLAGSATALKPGQRQEVLLASPDRFHCHYLVDGTLQQWRHALARWQCVNKACRWNVSRQTISARKVHCKRCFHCIDTFYSVWKDRQTNFRWTAMQSALSLEPNVRWEKINKLYDTFSWIILSSSTK